MQQPVKDTIHSALITAFTIAAALIWKDVIVEIIEVFVPPGEELFYKVLSAVAATVIIIIAIYLVTETESEAEVFIEKAERFAGRFKKKETKAVDKPASSDKPPTA